MNPQIVAAVLFPLLFAMAVGGLMLSKLLLNRLERVHPDKYEAMGRPSLFLRNNITNAWATQKFIFGREHKNLNDSYLSKLSDVILVFFVIYLLLFIGVFWVVASLPPAAA